MALETKNENGDLDNPETPVLVSNGHIKDHVEGRGAKSEPQNQLTIPVSSTTSSSLTNVSQSSISNKEAIDALLKRSGYPLVQENGQRKYGPPPNWLSIEPDRSCEVFIGKIPRDCFEDELVPLMERIGFVYEFRLMMEYSGYNRGYGFTMFTSREDAKRAVNELNNYEIRKGRTIGVCRSVDNCRLFVGGIPKNKKKEEILEEMRKCTEDVVNIIVYPSAHDKTKNRGFAFVQYSNHRAAAIARRKLIQNKVQLFEQPIAVDWAEPEPEVDETVMATVKVLYVRNLMLTTSEELIRAEFEKVKEGSVERVKKLKDFAFVHFRDREDALNALNKMNGSTIDGAIVECSLSKPAEKTALLRLAAKNGAAALIQQSNMIGGGNGNQLIDLNMLLNPSVMGLSYQPAGLLSGNELHPGSVGASGTLQIPYNTSSSQSVVPPGTLLQNASNSYSSLLLPGGAYLTATGYDLNGFMGPPPPQVMSHMGAMPMMSTGGKMTSNGGPQLNSGGNIRTPRAMSSNTVSSRSTAGLYRTNYNNNFVRGVAAGTVKKQASSQEVPYDLYSTGVNPVPLLSMNQQPVKYANNLATQILEDICSKENFGLPTYTLHTTTGVDSDGKELGLYTYKITIPALFNGAQIASNKLSKNIDEAKNESAEYALLQIFAPQATTYIDINELYFNYLQQKSGQSMSQQQQLQQQQQQQQQQQLVNHTTPSLTPPSSATTLIYPSAETIAQLNSAEFQSILAANQVASSLAAAAASIPGNESNLLKTSPASWQLAPQQPGPANGEYFQTVVTPQYILDPTGKYFLCQAPGWQ